MCGPDLGNEVYYHSFTVSTPTDFDRFIFAFRNPGMGTLLTLDLGVTLTNF